MDPTPSPTPPTPTSPATPPAGRSWAARARSLGPAGALGIAWLAFPPIGGTLLIAYMKSISLWFKSHGDLNGIAIFVAGFVVFAGLGLLPTYAQAILAGNAFGLWPGFAAALTGFTGAAILGYAIARWVSGDRVVKLIETNVRARVVRDALVGKQHPLRTFGIVTLLRIPPNSPFAISNLVMAGVRVPLFIFIPATLIGMAPRTFAAVYIGSTIEVLVGKPDTPRALVIAGIVLTIVVMIIVGVIAQRAIDRLSNKRDAIAPSTQN